VLSVLVDRATAVPIGDQIHASLRQAIVEGRLLPGQRLPSGRDLAAQLGVARGTIRVAYDRLIAENLVFGAGSAGTHVCARLPVGRAGGEAALDGPLADFTRPFSSVPLPFQMGVPAHDAFPAKLWARMRTRAVRADAFAYTAYADPRGEPALRAQIASHLAVSRQMQCHPDQIIVTSGYRQGLMLALTALRAHGRKAWLEEPGYPLGRRALEVTGAEVVPVPIDAEGLRVEAGVASAPDALLALVTPAGPRFRRCPARSGGASGGGLRRVGPGAEPDHPIGGDGVSAGWALPAAFTPDEGTLWRTAPPDAGACQRVSAGHADGGSGCDRTAATNRRRPRGCRHCPRTRPRTFGTLRMVPSPQSRARRLTTQCDKPAP